MSELLLNPAFISALALLLSAVVGVGTFVLTKGRLKKDQSDGLFEDALELSGAYKEAYQMATNEIQDLRSAVADLRVEVQDLIRAGEMWRAAAYRAAEDACDPGDDAPFWWPRGEPLPDIYIQGEASEDSI